MTKLKLSALALCGALFFGCFGGEEDTAPAITQGMEVQDIIAALTTKGQNLVVGVTSDISKAVFTGASVDDLKTNLEQLKDCVVSDNNKCKAIAKKYQTRYQDGEDAELNYENAMTLYQLSCIRKDSGACKDGVKMLLGVDKLEMKASNLKETLKSQLNTGSVKKDMANKAFLVVIDTVCEKIDAAIVGGNEICKPVGEVLAEVAAEKI